VPGDWQPELQARLINGGSGGKQFYGSGTTQNGTQTTGTKRRSGSKLNPFF
jgi:hypothetical protein